jgi:hypothetical protein
MTGTKVTRSLIGIGCLAAVLAFPAMAAAQASTFTIPFDRTGAPGQDCHQAIDPVTGLPVVDANGQPVIVCVPTGSFINPCTAENVGVLGSTTLSINVNISGSGSAKVSVGEVTKGTGLGALSGTTYAFSESQQFNTQFTLNGDPNTLTSSTFSDKLFMKGAKSVDNWTIKATFTIRINGQGVVTSVNSTMTGDICKG